MDKDTALQQAIEFEERSAAFYRTAADEMADPVLRAVLTQLADIEVQHVASVRHAYALSDTQPEAAADTASGDEGTATSLDPDFEGLIAQAQDALRAGPSTYTGIYETALEFERKAAAFYRRAATEHPSLGRFFTTMALLEELHVSMIVRILDANRRN